MASSSQGSKRKLPAGPNATEEVFTNRARGATASATASPPAPPAELKYDIFYQFERERHIDGDRTYESHRHMYDSDLPKNTNTQLIDVVMDIDLYLHLSGIASFLKEGATSTYQVSASFWENHDRAQQYRDGVIEFTPPPVWLELQLKRDRSVAQRHRVYRVCNHEGRHRAWVAKWVKGYRRIVVSVGAWLSDNPNSALYTMDRELDTGDIILDQFGYDKVCARMAEGSASVENEGAWVVWEQIACPQSQ
tara:strand:+ start:72 stop:821 length:750 start_codon:yes stop_codon:yes gene_type:complete